MSTTDPSLSDLTLRPVISNDPNEQRSEAHLKPLSIPKNRSTGDLLGTSGRVHNGISLSSFAATGDSTTRAPLLPEHEHGLGISGLRRIRQHPPSRAPSFPSSPSTPYALPPRSSSMNLSLSQQRQIDQSGPSSPILNTSEDLTRFPSESLHSFSFSRQSEDALHLQQNALKQALEFMQTRSGHGGSNQFRIMTAQAKVNGDIETQNMMELLFKANLTGKESPSAVRGMLLNGALTGPAGYEGNVFDQAFLPQIESPTQVQEIQRGDPSRQQTQVSDHSRPSSSHPEPSLGSEASVPEPAEPESPVNSISFARDSHDEADRGLKRSNTDVSLLNLQTKLVEALARPYKFSDRDREGSSLNPHRDLTMGPSARMHDAELRSSSYVQSHNARSVPAAQAIFTTETTSPWTILAANDLACLIFGVTKGEVKRLSMLEIVREDRRAWLEERLRSPGSETKVKSKPKQSSSQSTRSSPGSSNSFSMSGGITAKLLSKPSWRQQRAQTGDGEIRHSPGISSATKPRGVLLCGDVVAIQKRNGATGAASLWVKEKQAGLIWVIEEIAEDIVYLTLDEDANISKVSSNGYVITAEPELLIDSPIRGLIPGLPLIDGFAVDMTAIKRNEDSRYYAAKPGHDASVPVTVSIDPSSRTLKISSFPHIAGMMVLEASTLDIINANSVFSASLFGRSNPSGLKITDIIPQFDDLLEYLTEEDKIKLVDGIVVPEHSFQRAQALLAVKDGNADAAEMFLRPKGLIATHRDGSSIHIDIQMRVVRSEPRREDSILHEEKSEDSEMSEGDQEEQGVIVYALWITYSRHLHSVHRGPGAATPVFSHPGTPHHQPSPGQESRAFSPEQDDPDVSMQGTHSAKTESPNSSISQKIREAASQPISESPAKPTRPGNSPVGLDSPVAKDNSRVKKKISDFATLEDMGQGAYGQVKLARHTKGNGAKVVLKYVTKRRILVDTWTRDRRLGTVPLEIHVLDYLRRDGLRHPNIVEMIDFFEDDVNYYIEMVPHGLPGMDLFDYIEMRPTTDEAQCRSIFLQVVAALHHLHTKALVVHRDIKDENIILDNETNVKLIDFGSAAYIKNGPFDVFVGTIDYAAPEVLQGKSYRGKEQDIWALGILLYTLVYKENPFYSIDEILDHELRIPWIMSENSISLIKAMLDRDVDRRLTISQVLDHPWCKESMGEEEGKTRV